MKNNQRIKEGRGVPKWMDALDLDTPKGWRMYLVQVSKHLTSGRMKVAMGRTLTDIGRVGLYSFSIQSRYTPAQPMEEVSPEEMQKRVQESFERIFHSPHVPLGRYEFGLRSEGLLDEGREKLTEAELRKGMDEAFEKVFGPGNMRDESEFQQSQSTTPEG